MVVYDAGAGEIRTHYAGFFDPGFGFGDGSVLGTKVVMEVRAREVPFLVYDGQTSFKVWFEALRGRPEPGVRRGAAVVVPASDAESEQALPAPGR